MMAFSGAGQRLKRELRLGMMCSATLHLLVVLFALFGLPHLLPPPPEIEEAVPVELATIGDKTAPPPPQVKAKDATDTPAPPPPQPKPEPPKPEPTPEPTPAPPPPKPEPPKPEPPPPPKPPEPKPEPAPLPAPKPKPPEPEPPKPQQKPDEAQKPKPKDDFLASMQSALKDVDKRKPQQTNEAPSTGAKQTVNSTLASSSSQPTISEKDYVRAQIEKCWNFDPGARGAESLVVRVRILIAPDGTVTQADLDVDKGRYMSDPYYRAAADSARRAPLACSPLKTPPTRPDFYRSFSDITLNFDPRSLVR